MICDMEQPPVCSDCGTELPSRQPPCPTCGGSKRTFRIHLTDTLSLRGSLALESRHEFYERRPWAIGLVVTVTFVSSLLGLFLTGWPGVIAGLFLGGLAYFLGPHAVIKVREITRSQSN